jgi:large subunit ribosomal protein L28
MARCQICGKGTHVGRNIRHQYAGRWERRAPKTPRLFKANVQRKTLLIDGRPQKVKVCTSCLSALLKKTASL